MLSAGSAGPISRIAICAFIVLWIFFSVGLLGGRYRHSGLYSSSVDKLKTWSSNTTRPLSATEKDEEKEKGQPVPISYNLEVPPKTGCERVVGDLQLRLIAEYSKLLKGIRHVNLWGYLGTHRNCISQKPEVGTDCR